MWGDSGYYGIASYFDKSIDMSNLSCAINAIIKATRSISVFAFGFHILSFISHPSPNIKRFILYYKSAYIWSFVDEITIDFDKKRQSSTMTI